MRTRVQGYMRHNVEVETTRPVRLLTADPRRRHVRLYNRGSRTVWWATDESPAATIRGLPLHAYSGTELATTGEVWAIAEAGTQRLTIYEELDVPEGGP